MGRGSQSLEGQPLTAFRKSNVEEWVALWVSNANGVEESIVINIIKYHHRCVIEATA